MARKRRNSSSSESEDQPSPKRARPISIDDFDLEYDPPTTSEAPKVNPTYGQKGAFPGLGDDGDEDELFYGPASNGLEYLRMVRLEAKGVPHILVGSNEAAQSEDVNGYAEEGDGGGYYEDGAFIAAPDNRTSLPDAKDTLSDAQEAYYVALSSRFEELRTFLHQMPPLSAIEALTSDHPISLPPASAKAQQQWRFLLQTHEPQMTQLACMDMETVLEVVKLLKGLLAATVRSQSQEKMVRLGAWIWGVLGRCNEAGQLGSEEISELRELGKRAVGLLAGIRDRSGKTYGQEEDELEEEGLIEDEQETTGRNSFTSSVEPRSKKTTPNAVIADTGAPADLGSEAGELELAKAILQEKLSKDTHPQANESSSEEGEVEGDSIMESLDMPVKKQVRVTLDMIITIVGEFYGQRDLLEFRDVWEEEQSNRSI